MCLIKPHPQVKIRSKKHVQPIFENECQKSDFKHYPSFEIGFRTGIADRAPFRPKPISKFSGQISPETGTIRPEFSTSFGSRLLRSCRRRLGEDERSLVFGQQADRDERLRTSLRRRHAGLAPAQTHRRRRPDGQSRHRSKARTENQAGESSTSRIKGFHSRRKASSTQGSSIRRGNRGGEEPFSNENFSKVSETPKLLETLLQTGTPNDFAD